MIPLCKQEKENLNDLEQKYNNIKKFTNSAYKNDGKIEISTTSGTFLVWIATSGGGQTPSLVLISVENSKNIQYWGQGGMHNAPTYSNGKITITTKNQYFLYGYIKLR